MNAPMLPHVPPTACKTVGELIDAYMTVYAGRDANRAQRLLVWRGLLGERELVTVTDDDVFHALEALAANPARVYAGRDADGRAIYKARGPRSGPTVNRYHANLAAVFTWGIKRRRVAKGWENPCRKVDKRPENPGVVRFLDDAERVRLLEACKLARWPRMYALVLLALTTGARRGELTGLRWRDINLERGEAYVAQTKNGEPRCLILVPAAIEALKPLHELDQATFKLGQPSTLVFHSLRRPTQAFALENAWRAVLRQARVRRFRFHDLRHSAASYLAQNGATLLEIADVMGHRQLSMVKRYAHLTTGTKRALVTRLLGHIG